MDARSGSDGLDDKFEMWCPDRSGHSCGVQPKTPSIATAVADCVLAAIGPIGKSIKPMM
jgi:hypothetical protein